MGCSIRIVAVHTPMPASRMAGSLRNAWSQRQCDMASDVETTVGAVAVAHAATCVGSRATAVELMLCVTVDSATIPSRYAGQSTAGVGVATATCASATVCSVGLPTA